MSKKMKYSLTENQKQMLYRDYMLTKDFLGEAKKFREKIVGTTLWNKELKQILLDILQYYTKI